MKVFYSVKSTNSILLSSVYIKRKLLFSGCNKKKKRKGKFKKNKSIKCLRGDFLLKESERGIILAGLILLKTLLEVHGFPIAPLT